MPSYLFDCERMKYAHTGLYTYCKNLGQSLQKQLRAGERLGFFAPPDIDVFGDDAQYIRQNSLQKFYMPSLAGYDLWHATFQNSDYVPFRNRNIKVLLTIHDLNFMYMPSKSDRKKQKYLGNLQKLINRSAAIVCVSEYAKADVLRHCDVKGKPVKVIYNGLNMLESPKLSETSYRPSKPFLFSLGAIIPNKNIHSLLPLVENEDMELLIAGRRDDAEYTRYIIDEATRRGIGEKIRILGPITEEEKAWYYQNCCAFAFPSITEGFGLPVAEAMSAGKPLFLSNRTALPEIGRDAAFYFQDFSAASMQQTFQKGMANYHHLRMYERQKLRSMDFCWDKAAGEYLRLYREILEM